MAWGKSDEEKRIDAEQQAAADYWASPLGQAQLARDRGDGFFQLELDIAALRPAVFNHRKDAGRLQSTGGRTDLLAQIEGMGWRLEDIGYVFVETGTTVSSHHGATLGTATSTRGQIVGIYLFRAA